MADHQISNSHDQHHHLRSYRPTQLRAAANGGDSGTANAAVVARASNFRERSPVVHELVHVPRGASDGIGLSIRAEGRREGAEDVFLGHLRDAALDREIIRIHRDLVSLVADCRLWSAGG